MSAKSSFSKIWGDDFDPTVDQSAWNSTPTNGYLGVNTGNKDYGVRSTACGAYTQSALYFTGLGEREAVTRPLDLLGLSTQSYFQFYLRYGKDRFGSCEKVDDGKEVVLQYSIDDGKRWVTITEFSSRRYATMSKERVHIPSASISSRTFFRWRQKGHSSQAVSSDSLFFDLFDQWSIDEVALYSRAVVPTINSEFGLSTRVENLTMTISTLANNASVRYTLGNGSHAAPTCAPNSLGANVALTSYNSIIGHSGSILLTNDTIVKAVVCKAGHENEVLVSSPYKVVVATPTFSTNGGATNASDYLSVVVETTTKNASIWYTLNDVDGKESEPPECFTGFGWVGSRGEIRLKRNAVIRAIACRIGNTPSVERVSGKYIIMAVKPTISFVSGGVENSIIQLNSATSNASFAYIVVDVNGNQTESATIAKELSPSCDTPSIGNEAPANVYATATISVENTMIGANNAGSSSNITLSQSGILKVVACRAGNQLSASTTSTYFSVKPAKVQISHACSTTDPHQSVVTLQTKTDGASIHYTFGSNSVPTCNANVSNPNGTMVMSASRGTITLTKNQTIRAVACIDAMTPADTVTSGPITINSCCAGTSAYKFKGCEHTLLLFDDFEGCTINSRPDNSKWATPAFQFGGDNVNGGIHNDTSMVGCVMDSNIGRKVLRLNAHGDLFIDSSMSTFAHVKGRHANGAERGVSEHFTGWHWDGYRSQQRDCRPHCAHRRVGSAVHSLQSFSSGVLEVVMKPCRQYGTFTSAWIESPEGMGQNISSQNCLMRRQYSTLKLWRAALRQSRQPPCDNYRLANTDLYVDGKYHKFTLVWDAGSRQSAIYVDDIFQRYIAGLPSGYDSKELWLGVWFPNSWAGSPEFDTCETLVDSVKVTKLETATNRWCHKSSDPNVDIRAYPLPSQQSMSEILDVTCSTDDDCSVWSKKKCLHPFRISSCDKIRKKCVFEA